MRKRKIEALVPVEQYADPLHLKGIRPEHNILDPQVAQRLLDQARAPPGPGVANFWGLCTPCTSFCDWEIHNGGTRTWGRPEGAGTSEREQQGNACADCVAECCNTRQRQRVCGGKYRPVGPVPQALGFRPPRSEEEAYRRHEHEHRAL